MNKKTMYSDRDYLEQKFGDLGDQIGELHKIIVGNGEPGLVKTAQQNRNSIDKLTVVTRGVMWGLIILSSLFAMTHLQETAKFVVNWLEHKVL